jgi:hypothetical protein
MSDSTNMLVRFCSSQKKLERINRRHIEKVWAYAGNKCDVVTEQESVAR